MRLVSPSQLFVCLILGSLLGAAALANPGPRRSARPRKTQTRNLPVIVNGRTLSGPNSSARRDGEIVLVPAFAVAAALGDPITIDAASRQITVRRQDGTVGFLDAAIGRITTNGAVVQTFSNTAELIFTPNPAEMMLPSALASVLLDAAISYDSIRSRVNVMSGGPAAAAAQSSGSRAIAELYSADYEYGLSRYSEDVLA